MADITAFDYLLLPFYLFIIYEIAFYYRNKLYPDAHPFRVYFIPGLTVKLVSAILIGLIYKYYFGGGDTFFFFSHAQTINATFFDNIDTWFRLITHTANLDNMVDAQVVSELHWYDDPTAYPVCCLAAFIGLFCFTKYLIINILIASLVFIGSWLMFITFATQYSKNVKLIALAIIFMPGPSIWGSGLFKDSFCMFAIGSLIYCTNVLLEKRLFKWPLIFLSLFSATILIGIKPYILVVLLPVLIFKILLVNKKRINNNPVKKMIFYVIMIIILLGGYGAFNIVVSALAKYNTTNVLEIAKVQKDYLLSTNDKEGSFYDLGDFEPTLKGISALVFPAINVTLFRPYLWESRTSMQILNALESTMVLLFTLYILVTTNPLKIIMYIYQDSNLLMCLTFTLIFAFFVGISSYNFGALSRYKIPCTPFYMLFLTILLSKKNDEGVKINSNK